MVHTNKTIPTINVFSVQYKKTIMCQPYHDPLALPECSCVVILEGPGYNPDGLIIVLSQLVEPPDRMIKHLLSNVHVRKFYCK